jgi:hypothetical protein
MTSVMYKNGPFTVTKNEILTLEGSKPVSVKLLLQGKLDVFIAPSHKKPPQAFDELKHNSYRLFELEQNIFIGVNDIITCCKNSLSITAASDCSLFGYSVENEQNAWEFIYSQKDYGAYIINSLSTLICSSYAALQKADSYRHSIDSIYRNLCALQLALSQEQGLEKTRGIFSENGVSNLSILKDKGVLVPINFSRQFIETRFTDAADLFPAKSGVQDKITYFTHLCGLSADLRKTFFGSDQYITASHIKDAAFCLDQILAKLRQVFCALEEAVFNLYSDNEGCAYKVLLDTANRLNTQESDYTTALDTASYIYEKLKEITSYIEFEYDHKIDIDFRYLEHSHMNSIASFGTIMAGNEDISSVSDALGNSQSLPDELKDSTRKIIEYSEVPNDTATEFMMNLAAFKNLKDRLSSSEAAKNIRNAAAETFFDIYKAVFKKAFHTKDDSRLIKMFLSFGYMDERLLGNDQVLAIYKLAGLENANGSPNIHYMADWFAKIVNMEKDPSLNQFGQDYNDVFRELKKQGKVADKDKMAYDNDTDGRLTFETTNMFSTNHKLCQGQISTYFPILHKDMAPRNPVRSHVTPALINEKLNRILETDYSAFHREINYRNPSLGIEKETVMMQVIPDFILIPVYGSRAIMWQEISGRVRSTPGRLLIPVFTDENLDDLLVRLVGNFRWELCRTMMGSAWNDVTQSSLTSDYTDYIQFYRKNRDLTDEGKERLKSQITKYHNRTRDIFTADYELWINNEAKGNPRLNKVARTILFKHCPFSKPTRELLERQPMYIDMINLMRNQKVKLSKELESRYNKYTKANGMLDPVLESNLEFYRNM